MDDANRKQVKEYCAAFLYDQLAEAQRRYDRIVCCECTEVGGESCKCAVETGHTNGLDTGDAATHGIPAAKMSERGRNKRLGLLRSNQDTSWYTGSLDEEDRAAIARLAGLDISRHSAPTALPAAHHTKLIRQPSFMDQVYDGIKNPSVLIINNVNFQLNPAPRSGASADMDNLVRFLDKAGFISRSVRWDLRKQQMIDELEGIRQDPNLAYHDGLICVIMSHGGKQGILTKDLKYLEVEDITRRFQGHCCPQLATKPKLFFIQACRGNDVDKGFVVPRGSTKRLDVESDNDEEELPVKLPTEADFLVAYSSTKGKASFRRYTADEAYMEENMAGMGSWFISCLVDVFMAYAHQEDVLTMLTRVNQAMAKYYTDAAGHKQMACQLSMLTKKLYFTNLIERHHGTEGN